jgi:hypothetical protein
LRGHSIRDLWVAKDGAQLSTVATGGMLGGMVTKADDCIGSLDNSWVGYFHACTIRRPLETTSG